MFWKFFIRLYLIGIQIPKIFLIRFRRIVRLNFQIPFLLKRILFSNIRYSVYTERNTNFENWASAIRHEYRQENIRLPIRFLLTPIRLTPNHLKLIPVPNFSSLGWFSFLSAVNSCWQLLTADDSCHQKNLNRIFIYPLMLIPVPNFSSPG